MFAGAFFFLWDVVLLRVRDQWITIQRRLLIPTRPLGIQLHVLSGFADQRQHIVTEMMGEDFRQRRDIRLGDFDMGL